MSNMVSSNNFYLRTKTYRGIHDKLQLILASESDKLSPADRTKIDLLIDRFANGGLAPIRPADVFDLNMASAASIAGIIFTYVIVLMQFNVGDNTV